MIDTTGHYWFDTSLENIDFYSRYQLFETEKILRSHFYEVLSIDLNEI